MIKKWHVIEPLHKRRGCVIALPGRGMSAELMEKFCYHTGLLDSLQVILEPHRFQWYPAPNGAQNQDEAVAGLKDAVLEINKRISKVQRAFHLRRNQIAIIGFSAGSVMALQVMAASQQPLAAIASFAGAILQPEEMPEAPHQTPILLRHAIDDDCFSWDERYLPMRDALKKKNYNLYTSEKFYGGHGISVEDARVIGKFVAPYLGYEEPYDVEN
jgi:phospholipase/carboxylesterase